MAAAADSARGSFDRMLWDRALRSRVEDLVRRSALAGAATSAAIDGIEADWVAWSAGDVLDDTPVGRAAAGVVALYQELPRLQSAWETAPLQALARMHALVAAGLDVDPGRPRTGPPQDPLRLGTAVDPVVVPRRLQDLADRLVAPTQAPALVVSAIVHAELLTLQPFEYGSGLVARAAVRLTLAVRGVDPDSWSVPEAGIQAAGRPAYARAAKAYARGGRSGLVEWVQFHCQAMSAGTEGLAELVG